jgi:hypothetical protein
VSALQFETIKIALKQDRNGYVMTLRIHPDDVPDELLRDFVGARYMVAMVRLNDDETPKNYDNRVKVAAVLCKKPEFQQYIVELGYSETGQRRGCNTRPVRDSEDRVSNRTER